VPKVSRKTRGSTVPADVLALARTLDAYDGRYRELRGSATFGEYLRAPVKGADEETLTEPLLASILEDVLGYAKGDYFPQLGKSGLKPDFTPTDLVTHPFVFDAKGTAESLTGHVAQIRRYVDQRQLRSGVLFNGRQMRVYPRGSTAADKTVSFDLLPLWQAARGERLPVGEDFDAFRRFVQRFSRRTLSTTDKIDQIRNAESWTERLAEAEVDVEFLVDQLRRLAAELVADAAGRRDELEAYVGLDDARSERLLDELRQIALDIEPGVDLASLPATIAVWATGGAVSERVWRQYLLRVAYLALTRIMLYRAWEDVGFVDDVLYDGGFDEVYEKLDEDVRAVLRRAFLLGSDRYRTLFQSESTYEWYRPGEDVLVEVLYRLGAIPLGKLDQDALGALYVSYVDEIDRDRLGQFFTPRDVVRFMLDRAGFVGVDALPAAGDERVPLRILDFATGSGGFLVEAARRVIDDAGVAADDGKGLGEALRAVSTGFFGAEISPFPYYLTEINLLLQVSRLLGRMRVAGVSPPPFVLGVMRADTLASKSMPAGRLDVDTTHAELVPHDIYDVLPFEPEKAGKWRELRKDGAFDLVIGNPPYVAEANNKPLFEHFRAIEAWKDVYRGKTDYLYYFLLLAIEKLRPGGRLCVITPAGWMNAGSADFLREALANELTLDELFLFGSYRVFAADQGPAPTPTVESAILLATKGLAPKGHKMRVVALEDETAVTDLSRAELLDEMVRRFGGRQGRRRGIHVHDIAQKDLRPEHPWPVKHSARDVPARVVAHLARMKADPSASVEPLGAGWNVFRGIETGADAFTARIERRLTAAERTALDRSGATRGDPILELPQDVARRAPWATSPELLAKAPESRGILYGAIDDDFTYLVVLRAGTTPPRAVIQALEVYRPILGSRAEIARNPRREWWETAWPRDANDMAAPKVIALYRTDRGRFALDETGDWHPSTKATLVVGREAGAPVAYLCGLLNSELLDLWYAVRGKTPWHVRRNYEPKRMNEMPYRRPEGDPRPDEIAALVREIAANRRELLPHRGVVRDLARIVKDPWRAGPVVVDRPAFVRELPKRETVSVRLDPTLDVIGRPSGRPRREARDTLAFRRGREETGRVVGDPARLDLLAEIVGDGPVDDVSAVLLPKDMARLEVAASDRAALVVDLLTTGRRLVEKVERLVCALYDVPDDLTEAVVEHAVTRASKASRGTEEGEAEATPQVRAATR
jgi:hypothetical protein